MGLAGRRLNFVGPHTPRFDPTPRVGARDLLSSSWTIRRTFSLRGSVGVEAFRSQEERCRRLAKSIYNIQVAADPEAHAQHLDL